MPYRRGRTQGPRHRPRRRRGQAADAADRRPRQARRAVRRHLPAHRLRAVATWSTRGYLKVVVLTQYKSHSLDRHVTKTWRMSTHARQLRRAGAGPAARRQAAGTSARPTRSSRASTCIHDEKPDIVVVVGADHVYRMDFRQMVDAAHRDRRRRARSPRSASRSRSPTSSASSRSTPTTRRKIARVPARSPRTPKGLPDSPDEVLASMGNYVFDADALIDAVTQRQRPRGQQARHGRRHRARLRRPRARPTSTTSRTTTCPGATDRDRGYWRDVGTIDSYYDAHMDLVSIHPVFNLYNYEWPIYTDYGPYPPAKFVHGAGGQFGEALNSAVSPGVRHLRRARHELGALAARATSTAARRSTTACCSTASRSAATASIQRAIIDKDVVGPRGRDDRGRPRARPGPRLHGHRVGHHRRRPRCPGPVDRASDRRRRPARSAIGVQLQPQHADYAADPARLRRGRGDRRRRRLQLGPLLPALRRPGRRALRVLDDARRLGRGDRARRDRRAGHLQQLPQPATCSPTWPAPSTTSATAGSSSGIGSGWFERDYDEYGYEFGTAGGRLDALGARPAADHATGWAELNPRADPRHPGPHRRRRRDARRCGSSPQHADIWHGFGDPETIAHKHAVLDEWCAQGRTRPRRDRALGRRLAQAGPPARGRRATTPPPPRSCMPWARACSPSGVGGPRLRPRARARPGRMARLNRVEG